MSLIEKIKKDLKEGRSFLQFSFLSAFGQGLGMITPLIIARFFTPDLLGNYYLTKTAVFFFTTLLLSYMQTPFVVFANQEREKTGLINKSFSVQCSFYAFSLLIFCIIILLGGRAITDFAKISFNDLFIIIGAFLGFTLKTVICDLFLAMGQRIKNALAEFVFGLVIFICVVYLCATGLISLKSVFLVYLLSGLIVAILFVWFIEFRLLFPLTFDKRQFRETILFAKWIFIGTAAAYFIGWGNDNIVLRFNTTTSNIGTYNLGCDIYRGIMVLIFIIYPYFLPFVSQYISDISKIREFLWKKRPKIFLLGFTGIIAIILFAPYAFQIVYKGEYNDSSQVLRILLIAAILSLYNIFYETIFHSLKKYRITQTINIFHAILNLILDIILVPAIGIKGAAIATVLCYGARVFLYEIYFRFYIRKTLILA